MLAVSASVILLLLGSFFFLLQPGEKADKQLAEGLRQMERGDFTEAVASFERAYALDPSHPESGLALFDAIAFFQPQRARKLLDELASHSSVASERVLAGRIELALRKDQIGKARQLASELQGKADSFAVLHALAQLSVRQHGVQHSMPLLRDLLNRFPLEREAILLKARLFHATGNKLDQVRAKTLLRGLFGQTDATSFQAAAFLLAASEFPLFEEEIEEATAHLRRHPFLTHGLQRIGLANLRLLIRRTARSDPETALRMAKIMREDPGAGEQEDLLFASIAQMNEGGLEEAQKILRELEKEGDPSPAQALVLIRQDFLEGKNDSAFRRIERFLADQPDNKDLFEVIRRRLARQTDDLRPEEHLRLLDFLLEYPGAETKELLAAYRTKLELLPDQKPALLEEVHDRFAEAEPVALGYWMLGIGENSKALALVPQASALRNKDAFAIRFEALTSTGRENEARSLVKAASAVLTEFEEAFALARIAVLGDEMEKARGHLQTCAESMYTEEERSRIFDVTELAFLAGDQELQLSLYDRAFGSGLAFPEKHALFFMSHLLDKDGVAAAKRFTSFLRSTTPDHPDFINNDCYLDALLQQNLDQAIDEMDRIVRRHPENPHYRITLALSQLLGGYNQSALATLNESEGILDPESVHTKMVFALVLAGNGKESIGRNLLGDLDPSELLAEERQLIDEFLFGSDEF